MPVFMKPCLSPAEFLINQKPGDQRDSGIPCLTISIHYGNPAPRGLAAALKELKARGWSVSEEEFEGKMTAPEDAVDDYSVITITG